MRHIPAHITVMEGGKALKPHILRLTYFKQTDHRMLNESTFLPTNPPIDMPTNLLFTNLYLHPQIALAE